MSYKLSYMIVVNLLIESYSGNLLCEIYAKSCVEDGLVSLKNKNDIR